MRKFIFASILALLGAALAVGPALADSIGPGW